jgi:hypothetical protein
LEQKKQKEKADKTFARLIFSHSLVLNNIFETATEKVSQAALYCIMAPWGDIYGYIRQCTK